MTTASFVRFHLASTNYYFLSTPNEVECGVIKGSERVREWTRNQYFVPIHDSALSANIEMKAQYPRSQVLMGAFALNI